MEKEITDYDNEVVFCKRCHRRLKDIEAKKLGYGKICYEKIKPKYINYLFEIKEEHYEVSVDKKD